MVYIEIILHLSFSLAFVLTMSVNRFPLRKTALAGILMLAVLIVAECLLYRFWQPAYFQFFYPVTATLAGMFFVMAVSEYNGLKSIFPLLVGLFFVTISITLRDVLLEMAGWSMASLLIAEFALLALALIGVDIFLKPFYVTTVRFSSDGWVSVDMSLFIYFLMIFLMYGTMDMSRIIGIRAGLQIIVLILVVSICEFTARALREREREYNKALLMEQAKAGAAQIEAYRESEKRMSIFRHDMRHWLGAVDQLIEAGHYDEAREMVNTLSRNMEQTRTQVYCENIYVNAIFSMHAVNAEKEDVTVDIQADIPQELSFDAVQFSVVISNLLENALKAVKVFEEKELRKVMVRARNTGYSQIIEISNPYKGEIQIDENGYPIAESEGHGIGMISVDTFVKEMGAILNISHDNGIFKAALLINC